MTGNEVCVQHVYDTDSIGRYSVVSQRVGKADWVDVIYKTGAFFESVKFARIVSIPSWLCVKV